MTRWQRLLILLILPLLLGGGVLVSAWHIRRLEYGDQVFLSVNLREGKVVAAGVDYHPAQVWASGQEIASLFVARLRRCPDLSRPPFFQSTLVQPLPGVAGLPVRL